MERAPALEELARRLCRAVGDGDTAFLDVFLSRREGVLGIGPDPQEGGPPTTPSVGCSSSRSGR